MKHTQGPWSASNASAVHSQHIISADNDPRGYAVAVIYGIDEHEANAHLIAAAPDLLAALRECITNDGANAWTDKMTAFRRLHAISDIARAAIAKAEAQ